jgi:predicted DNA-binding protein (MmcQ/YjbR family)
MNKTQLLRLVKESRQLIKTASPEQKLRLLSLIRESYKEIKKQQFIAEDEVKSNSSDYLDEK